MASEPTLLFLPDISGFTKFVNETEVDHSQHIIQELIEAMLDANKLKLEVAEIEGDAIFFYSKKMPSFDKLHDQIEGIFKAFHTHIKKYENQRICNCGACTGAVDLKLKFVVHSGEVGYLKIKGNSDKPHGKEVVAAHRLLKNKIGHSQYVLYSNQFIEQSDFPDSKSAMMVNGSMEEKDLRNIGFKYELIDQWENKIEDPGKAKKGILIDSPLEQKIEVKRNISDVFQFISDFRYRYLWNQDAVKIEYDPKKLNRVGTEHYCIVNKERLSFETVTQDFDDNPYVYGESLKNSSLFKDFANYFVLEETDSGSTEVTMQFHVKPKSWFHRLLMPIIKFKITKTMIATLKKIQEVGEEVELNPNQNREADLSTPLDISA